MHVDLRILLLVPFTGLKDHSSLPNFRPRTSDLSHVFFWTSNDHAVFLKHFYGCHGDMRKALLLLASLRASASATE